MSDFLKKYCLDCIREGAEDPKLKARGGSYCNHHIHVRSMASKGRVQIKNALNLLRLETDSGTEQALAILNARDRYTKPKLSASLLAEFAKACDEQVEELRKTAIEAGRSEVTTYRPLIEQEMLEAFILRNRRLPEDPERLRIHAEAHPFYYEDELALATEDRYQLPKVQEPDDNDEPETVRHSFENFA